MPRALFALILVLVALVAARERAEPNTWFLPLVIEDQQHDSHDHSGEAARRENHTCCHRMAFDEDPITGDALIEVDVPYNHWWRKGAVLVSVSPTLDERAQRLLRLGNPGLILDFRQHSRLYIRLQCAFPCCLEAAEFVIPNGAEPLVVLAGNASVEIEPWEFDSSTLIPAGHMLIGGGRYGDRRLSNMMWVDRHYESRLDALRLCDHSTRGTWIQVDSPSRIQAALTELDVCFVDHDVVPDFDSGLCEENTF